MPEAQFKRDILHSDFEQSMEMLRHYDNFHWDITKFCFSQICIVIGACWYIYEKNEPRNQSISILEVNISVIALLLLISSLFTLLCIVSLLRNRTYFCKVSHYINELRKYGLSDGNDLIFLNVSGMWSNENYPPLKDCWSTQFLSIYLLALCFIAGCGISVFMLFPPEFKLMGCIVTIVVTIIILIIFTCQILK